MTLKAICRGRLAELPMFDGGSSRRSTRVVEVTAALPVDDDVVFLISIQRGAPSKKGARYLFPAWTGRRKRSPNSMPFVRVFRILVAADRRKNYSGSGGIG